jgi:putative DNA primase/helicase
VDAATAAYRAETDVTERFFEDACVFDPEERVSKKGLFEAWEDWCGSEGEDPGKQNSFSRGMRERGAVKKFGEKKIGGTWYWTGIGLASKSSRTSPGEKFPNLKTPANTRGVTA